MASGTIHTISTLKDSTIPVQSINTAFAGNGYRLERCPADIFHTTDRLTDPCLSSMENCITKAPVQTLSVKTNNPEPCILSMQMQLNSLNSKMKTMQKRIVNLEAENERLRKSNLSEPHEKKLVLGSKGNNIAKSLMNQSINTLSENNNVCVDLQQPQVDDLQCTKTFSELDDDISNANISICSTPDDDFIDHFVQTREVIPLEPVFNLCTSYSNPDLNCYSELNNDSYNTLQNPSNNLQIHITDNILIERLIDLEEPEHNSYLMTDSLEDFAQSDYINTNTGEPLILQQLKSQNTTKFELQSSYPWVDVDDTSTVLNEMNISNNIEVEDVCQPQSITITNSNDIGVTTNTSQEFLECLQIMGEQRNAFYQILQEKEKERERNELSMEIRNFITITLTLNNMRQELTSYELFRQWSSEIERYSQDDGVRLRLLRLTVENAVLKRLKLDSEDILVNFTWKKAKQKLASFLPKISLDEIEMELLQNSLQFTDDAECFTSKLSNEYNELCEILGVSELNLPLSELLAITLTANMTPAYKQMYYWAIQKDPETAIKRLDKALQNKGLKSVIFDSADSKVYLFENSDYEDESPIQPQQVNSGSEYDIAADQNKYLKRCWHFDSGFCHYGKACKYVHVDNIFSPTYPIRQFTYPVAYSGICNYVCS